MNDCVALVIPWNTFRSDAARRRDRRRRKKKCVKINCLINTLRKRYLSDAAASARHIDRSGDCVWLFTKPNLRKFLFDQQRKNKPFHFFAPTVAVAVLGATKCTWLQHFYILTWFRQQSHCMLVCSKCRMCCRPWMQMLFATCNRRCTCSLPFAISGISFTIYFLFLPVCRLFSIRFCCCLESANQIQRKINRQKAEICWHRYSVKIRRKNSKWQRTSARTHRHRQRRRRRRRRTISTFSFLGNICVRISHIQFE